MKLTDGVVAGLTVPEGRTELVVFDDDIAGFGVRVRRGGSRRFILQYRLGDRVRKLTFRAESVKAARKTAGILMARVTANGEDVAAIKSAAQDAAGDTFKRCLDRYLARPQGRRRPSTIKEIKRHLERNLAPLHGLHIKLVDRRRIAEQLSRLSETAPVQANRTRASLSKFLNWCIGEGFVDVNVALQTNKNDEISRDRVLNDAELQTIWNCLSPGDFGDIIKLLILTGQREKEISELRWSEIDMAKAEIRLPSSRTKNHRAHTIPLSRPALSILRARQSNATKGRDLVFGSGKHGFSGWSKSKARLDEVANLSATWLIHDLRRSFATGAAELGVAPHIIESILNHVSGAGRGGALAAIYNRAKYDDEKRTGMALWGDHVMAVVAKAKRIAA